MNHICQITLALISDKVPLFAPYSKTRAEKSKSLIHWKRREKAGKGSKGEFDLQLDFWQKSGDVVNPDSKGSA